MKSMEKGNLKDNEELGGFKAKTAKDPLFFQVF